MYLPYLRGKQFELLALRELSRLPLDGKVVSPIIEPLKLDTRGIQTMFRALAQSVNVNLIVNPEFGEIKNGNRIIANFITNQRTGGQKNIIPTFLISSNRDLEFAVAVISDLQFSVYSLIHQNQISAIQQLIQLGSAENCLYNIISISNIIALRRNFPKRTLAYLSDPFNRQKKNADYLHVNDENFSNDHLYYQEEGFVAFGDYLTIGASFVDGGRLPWAVVIHLTYKEAATNNIRIKHFVSDSNDDDSDTAGKFSEALNKLIIFIDANNMNSLACDAFRDLKNRGAFPGLGTIKKLSIMHHIELVQSLLQ